MFSLTAPVAVVTQAVRAYRDVEEGAARAAQAAELNDEFVKEGAPRQVNLPSEMQREIQEALAALAVDGSPPSTLFDRASDEIFKLMEKDTFNRFKQDDTASDALVERFYTSMGLGPDDPVSFASFKAWALGEPSILVFFSGLCESIRRLVDKAKTASKQDEAAAKVQSVVRGRSSRRASDSKSGAGSVQSV